jgi:hypothetical protein
VGQLALKKQYDCFAGMTDHFLLRQRRELLGVTADSWYPPA